jgi:serine/threonine-protein kinase
MANANLPPDAERDLLYGVLALQLEFVGPRDLQQALQAWAADRSRPLSQVLIERQALAPRRRALLDALTLEYLVQHDMDVTRGLAAACAARATPVELGELTAAMRGNLATLPAASTLPQAPEEPPIAHPVPAGPRRYRAVRRHARGALGEVFVAHDEELNREVALKEIQEQYADSAESRARFVLEAEITGSLEHPGVVPVYSLGTHPNGRPFYAMRFIKGESLYEAIGRFHGADAAERDPSERALSLRGLLGRFVAVCNAVAYAHARGVIHRDLKPSNIMLGPYGETLVVDWGLAKAFNQPMTPDSVELPIHPQSSASTHATMLGQAVGTPAYMPPEQAAGRVDQVGPASDIYSLGATLYNLVVGQPAFHGSASEVLRQVTNHDFPPPRRANPRVPAALEAVILKAMAFHPENRYASVHELAGEIERWLADEPVLAYRESLAERAGRWMRRHRPYVSAAAALLVTAVIGLAGGLYAVNNERSRTQAQARIAEQNLDLAKAAVKECFTTATEHPLLRQARMRGVRKVLLEKALEFYEKTRFANTADDSIRLEYADNKFREARITEEIGSKDKAIESYQTARGVFEALSRSRPDSDEVHSNLSRILNNLGTLQRGEEARKSLEEALKIRLSLARANQDNLDYQSELAQTYNNLGAIQRFTNPAEAAGNFDRAREIFGRLAGEKPENDRYQTELAASYHNQGDLLAFVGEVDPAMKAYESALAIREALAKKRPLVGDYRADVGRTLLSMAALVAPLGKEALTARAVELRQRAVKLFEALVQEDREVVEYQVDLARARSSLGQLLGGQPGQIEAAVQMQRMAVADLEKIRAQHRDVAEYSLDLAGAYVNLGKTLAMEGGRPAEAPKLFDQAVAQLAEAEKLSPKHEDLQPLWLKAYWGRGEAYVKLREFTKGLADFDAALAKAPPAEPEYNMIRKDKAFALARAGRHGDAVRLVNDLENTGDDRSARRGALFYELACIAALAAKAAEGDKSLSTLQKERLTKTYSDRAIHLLTRAQIVGFFDDPKLLTHFLGDDDFTFLRTRCVDFQKFEKSLRPKEENR